MRDIAVDVLNHRPRVEDDFKCLENVYFNAYDLPTFDADTGEGTLRWKRYGRKPRMSFNGVVAPFEETIPWEFPPAYGSDQQTALAVSFVNASTLRIRIGTKAVLRQQNPSPMLAGPVPDGQADWDVVETEAGITYSSARASVVLRREPWRMEIYDGQGRLLTQSLNMADTLCLLNSDPTPFSFVRRQSDQRCRMASTFSLAHDEKLFGGGESFTRLDKRGQRLHLWSVDAHGAQTQEMYKPIPFLLSSRGYGLFVHTSAPLTMDVGHDYDQANTLFLGDDELDLFVFVGKPKDILGQYTDLTGRSPLPPLWSFGLWMGRITYTSEAEVRDVAEKLRQYQIPCDVIHIDTGWFETDWQCDYAFAPSRFADARTMIADLRQQGLRVSLWQLPYFTPNNRLYQEAIERGYVVLDADGHLPTGDAIIDFTNPEAVRWYQSLLRGLLEMGVAAIKVDFGEAAPMHGCYASGRSGWHEHNLYPLHYNRAAAQVTKDVSGEDIIWARSAWAGSQRYPLHWGGDAENTDSAMAASLRAGMSLGLCGFSFWSHDLGGFVKSSEPELYLRWAAWGALTSHSRCHGAPPTEPWHYGEDFTAQFRNIIAWKYRLLPYIYAQAKLASEQGLPMMRPLFMDFPEDRTAWTVDDQYLFGEQMLVAPLFSSERRRSVYVPAGTWYDLFSGQAVSGGCWHQLEAGEIPIIALMAEGSALPTAAVAQNTGNLDWNGLKWRVFGVTGSGKGALYRPGDAAVARVTVDRQDGKALWSGVEPALTTRWTVE